MGDSVVAASELCDRAERGEIFVGPETWRQTREDFEFEERDALEIKGRSEPLTSYELCSRTQRLHRARVGVERRVFSNLVGREEEMARLGQALEDVRAGRGGIISLVAEAGVGKSRLIAELAGSAAAQEVAWREGRSLSTGQQLSFHPFADLCRSWAGITDDDDDEAARDKLHQAVHDLLGERTDEAYPFLATLMGLHLDEAQRERLERIEGQSLEKLIRAAVTQLLRAGSQIAPVVVVLDDLHWADASSIELLESLLRLTEDHAILFLHPCRPGFASTSDRIREYAREHHAERHLEFELQPLDDRAARRMVKNLFREDDLPQATRALIEEKARGNPFYIEEVVRSLLDQGAVEYEDGRFVATERIHNVEIPGTVQEVVMARVDRLGLRRRQLLQLASVIGQSFHHDILEEVRGPGPELAEDLDELQALEFLVPWDRLQGEEYAFKHPLIQEVAYDGILRARREELHRGVAQATERRLPPETPGFDAMLAYHFSMGRDAERAETYLFRAGDEAARVAASSEALHFFQEARRCSRRTWRSRSSTGAC
jgi:predicted ATPase